MHSHVSEPVLFCLEHTGGLSYPTCMEVNSNCKQGPCDGHEGLAVVIWVKSNSPDPLMDGIHQK